MTATAPAAPAALGGRKVLLAALLLGAVTAGLIVAFLARQEPAQSSPFAASTRSVVVARQDLAAGTVLDAGMVEVRDLPENVLLAGALADPAQVIGETVRYPVAKGDQFTLARLVEPAKQKSLSFTIPSGLRGFTIAVDVTTSPAALLVPGDFVDVIVAAELLRLLPGVLDPTATIAQNERPKAAVTLIQNVQVISVQRRFVDSGVPYDNSTRGTPAGDSGDNVNYVTLAVTPAQAQLLWLATQEGSLTLSLRGFGDAAVEPISPVAEPIRLP